MPIILLNKIISFRKKNILSLVIISIVVFSFFFYFCAFVEGSSPDSPTVNPGSQFNICTGNVDQPACYDADSPTPILNWTFTSSNGVSSQGAYQVKIDNNGDHEGSYPSPEVDTGEILSSDESHTVNPGKLQFNTTYYWKVAVKDNFNTWSGWTCADATFTTANCCVPADPSNLSATADYCSEISLSWTDNSDDEDGFKIERKPSGGSWSQIHDTQGADVTTYGDSGLSENTEYYYRVRAYNDGGNSGYSNEANDTTLQCILSVALSADPSSGYAPLNDVDLTATVTGNISGTINYTFYCNRSDAGTNITSGWAAKYDGITDNPKTAADVCDYATVGTYAAKVIVERGSLAVENREAITTLSNPPTATNLSVTKGNYCTYPAHYFSWTYSDPDEDNESKFQFQVDNNSGFGSPEVNRTITGTWSDGDSNNQTVVVAVSPSASQIGYNTTYYWRVKVWDSQEIASAWIQGSSFTTEEHRYPSVDFNWSPIEPSQDEDVLFADQSTVYGGSTKSAWSWAFTNGNPASSSQQNPTIQFTSDGSKEVTLGVTDSDNFSCQISKSVGVQAALPAWQEILPQ